MGVYPVGTIVELDTGERAVVVRQNEQIRHIHRPVVAPLGDRGAHGNPIDLADRGDRGSAYRRTIVRSLYDESLEVQKAACFVVK
jgi:hypothetical protein